METIAFYLSLVCWLIFYFFWWFASTREAKRSAYEQSLPGRIRYRIPAWLAFILIFGAYTLPSPLSLIVINHSIEVSITAMLFSMTGLVICIWARTTLGRNWSHVVSVKESHELVQQGPYKFMRHPIYTGILMMFAANVFLCGRVGALLGLGLLTLSFVMKLLQEEAVMLKEFPAAYPDYMRRVKRLVPYIV